MTDRRRQTYSDTLTDKGDLARQRIIACAQVIFGRDGFDGASMRTIASEAEMGLSSLYHHFSSKDELLGAVWEKGGLSLHRRMAEALDGVSGSWRRLEVACTAHVEGLLDFDRANQLLFIIPSWQYPPSIRDRIIEIRDDYERFFVDVIDALPLKPSTDRKYLRLMLIGSLSWPLFWYHEGQITPSGFARQVLEMIRLGIDPS